MGKYQENPEIPQDRTGISFSLYEQTGKVVFHTSERIYKLLVDKFSGEIILEAGCGIGWGAALLSQRNNVTATDKNKANVTFAKALYPWLKMDVWDIAEAPYKKTNIVIAIDVVEHIKRYKEAFKNLIASARSEVWISTPNRNSPLVANHQPKNKYHVKEFVPQEVLELTGNSKTDILDWRDLSILDEETSVNLLVYRIYV